MLADYFAGATETLILIPKKNGKTTLLAALALAALISTRDAEIVVAASSRDQATILFDQAFGFIGRSERLQERMVVRRGFREIRSRRDRGRIRVLASDVDTADGVIPTLALVDELHRMRDDGALYGVFRDGLGPRHGRMITISTAGDDDDTPLGKMRKAALEQTVVEREDAYTYARSGDGGFVMHEWALNADDDLQDLELVKRANPASWQTLEALKRRRDSPSTQPWQWARFAAGVWVAGEDSAISPVDWARCAEPGLEIPDGADVFVGLDLGWKWDTTAAVPVWHDADGDRLVVGHPAILEPPRDGSSLEEEQIEAAIFAMRERWRIRAIIFDRNAGGQQLAQRLERRHRMTVVDHSQDPAPMALAAERLSAAVRSGELRHPDDPALTRHVLSAVAKATTGEKWRLVKSRSRRGGFGKPIDAAIGLAMAVSVAKFPPARPRPMIEVFS